MLRTLLTLSRLVLISVLPDKGYYYPSYIDEETEDQQGKQLIRDHTASKWQSQDSNPEPLTSKLSPSTTVP